MALASYGEPRHLGLLREVVRTTGDGRFVTEPVDWPALAKRRRPEEEWTPDHADLAASVQRRCEEVLLDLAGWLHGTTGEQHLTMAGGVALNCVANTLIAERTPFTEVWVQPAAGDAGTALGAALWVDSRERGGDERHYEMTHALLGPQYDDAEIESFLQWSKFPFRRMANVAEETAEILAQDKVIGWFQGRMEFGPRALGARSILASPIHLDMQSRLRWTPEMRRLPVVT